MADMKNAGIQFAGNGELAIAVDATGTVQGFKDLLEAVGRDPGVRGVLVLACQENGFTPGDLDPVLRAAPAQVFGGVFPGVIHEARAMMRGTVMVGLRCPLKVRMISGPSRDEADFDLVLDEFGLEMEGHRTMLMFVDAQYPRIAEFMKSLFVVFGLEFNYLGGGAGSMEKSSEGQDSPFCLFTNQGMARDAIQLAALDMPCSIGVSHGWGKIAGPFMVTETRGHRVLSLDWRPAREVYQQAVERHLGRAVGGDEFMALVPHFPLGLEKFQAEHVIRDAVAVDGDDLIFGVGMPEGTFVHVMSGSQETLMRAAGEAYAQACEGAGGNCRRKAVLLMDCCTRWLFMRQGFEQELELLNRDGLPLAGALTMGEIANSGHDFLEYFNKTCVVGMVGD